ncbi:putative inorganic carbon transporter subunit DabA, partial [Geobacillus stearothermophilus]|nr:Na-translocating system protein MpsB [Geobacillus stearothermophilus]
MSKSAMPLERLTGESKPTGAEARPLAMLVSEAAKAVAPLWPISAFIARHPWMGLEEQTFSDAAARLQQAHGIDLYPPMAVFHAAMAKGEIDLVFVERRLQRWLDNKPLPVRRQEAERMCRALLWNETVPNEALRLPELAELAHAAAW